MGPGGDRVIKDYFIFDGINSSDYGVVIEEASVFQKPQAGMSTVKIPGRTGDLLIYEDRFENITVSYQCHCDYYFRSRIDSLISALSSKRGYKRLTDSVYPEYYRRAYFQGPVNPKLLRAYRAGSFQINFKADPRKFLLLGEYPPISLASGGKLYNPTSFEAKPLIHCVGTSGTVTVGGVTLAVTGASSYVDIDCEAMEVYEGSTSRNGTTTLTDGAFPTIPPGESAVTFTGFSSVQITPRWWML